MNFGKIIEVVDSRLGDIAKTRHAPEYIKFLINEGQKVLASNTSFYKKTMTFLSVSGEQEYSLKGPLSVLAAPTLVVGGVGGDLDQTAVYQYKILAYSSILGIKSVISSATSEESGGGPHYMNVTVVWPSDGAVDKIHIYRTEGGESTFKYLTEMSRGTTSYTDGTADGSLGAEYSLAGLTQEGDFLGEIALWWDDDTEIKNKDSYPTPYRSDQSTGIPTHYYIFEDKLNLISIPSVNGTNIMLYYVAEPAVLSAVTDIPNLAPAVRMVLVYYTLWQIMEEEGQKDRVAFHMAKYEQMRYEVLAHEQRMERPMQVKDCIF